MGIKIDISVGETDVVEPIITDSYILLYQQGTDVHLKGQGGLSVFIPLLQGFISSKFNKGKS